MTATSRRGRRSLGSAVAALVAVVAVLLGVTAPAYAGPPSTPVVEKYVALGDSYAAGQGAGVSLDSCQRSAAAYPVLLDAEPRTNLLRTAACSGATIADVAATQLSQVNRGTTLVTITVGANDLGVGAIAAACTINAYSPECYRAVDAAEKVLASGAIGAGIASLVGAVAERAPSARIVVADYPIPYNATSDLEEYVNQATALLDQQIGAGVAAAAGKGADVVLAPMAFSFIGHQIGDGTPYLGGNPGNLLTYFHPTAEGQAIYRVAILAALAS
jgi:lysophospholipase L1-like esterase